MVTHTLWLLVTAVVGMGIHSTLFGPVKYAYLPQQLKPEELIGGNGVTEMGTFVGILLGEILGAVLVVQKPNGIALEAIATIAVALLGLLASYRFPNAPAPVPELKVSWNFVGESIRNINSRARTAWCSCRCWAIRGSGSTARWCWRSSPSTPRTSCTATTACSCCC